MPDAEPVVVTPKPNHQSWSNWINGAALLFGSLLLDPSVMDLLQSVLGRRWPATVVIVTALANILRRRWQNGPIIGSIGETLARSKPPETAP